MTWDKTTCWFQRFDAILGSRARSTTFCRITKLPSAHYKQRDSLAWDNHQQRLAVSDGADAVQLFDLSTSARNASSADDLTPPNPTAILHQEEQKQASTVKRGAQIQWSQLDSSFICLIPMRALGDATAVLPVWISFWLWIRYLMRTLAWHNLLCPTAWLHCTTC